MTALMALISGVSLNDLINWNFSMFCEVLLKVREVCLQYNFDEILLLCLALLIIFR